MYIYFFCICIIWVYIQIYEIWMYIYTYMCIYIYIYIYICCIYIYNYIYILRIHYTRYFRKISHSDFNRHHFPKGNYMENQYSSRMRSSPPLAWPVWHNTLQVTHSGRIGGIALCLIVHSRIWSVKSPSPKRGQDLIYSHASGDALRVYLSRPIVQKIWFHTAIFSKVSGCEVESRTLWSGIPWDGVDLGCENRDMIIIIIIIEWFITNPYYIITWLIYHNNICNVSGVDLISLIFNSPCMVPNKCFYPLLNHGSYGSGGCFVLGRRDW